MAEGNSSTVKDTKKRSGIRRSNVDIAAEFVVRDGEKAFCKIDSRSGCSYVQMKYDIGNFIRHFRSRHAAKANEIGILKEFDPSAKKPRLIAKRPIAIDKPLLIDSAIKMVSYHQLPLSCFEWEGIRQIFEPIGAAVGCKINSTNIKTHIQSIAHRIRDLLKEEMRNKLISVKIDSASRFYRHILGINAQYVLNSKVVVRTLGKLVPKRNNDNLKITVFSHFSYD